MLRHIVGLLAPDSGRVLVQGEDLTRLSAAAIAAVRQQVGFLFQNAALFDSLTVGDNVAFPLRRHTRLPEPEISSAGAGQAGSGWGWPATTTRCPQPSREACASGRGLARAMALDPAILLVDEPSAGLDPITSEEIDDLLVRVKEELGTTLVVVTHNIPSARRIGDTLVFLYQGKVLERGSAEQLEQSPHAIVRQFLASESGG